MRPTIILVHCAFAESSSWDGLIDQLLGADYPVRHFAPLASGSLREKPPHAQTPCGLVFDRKK